MKQTQPPSPSPPPPAPFSSGSYPLTADQSQLDLLRLRQPSLKCRPALGGELQSEELRSCSLSCPLPSSRPDAHSGLTRPPQNEGV